VLVLVLRDPPCVPSRIHSAEQMCVFIQIQGGPCILLPRCIDRYRLTLTYCMHWPNKTTSRRGLLNRALAVGPPQHGGITGSVLGTRRSTAPGAGVTPQIENSMVSCACVAAAVTDKARRTEQELTDCWPGRLLCRRGVA